MSPHPEPEIHLQDAGQASITLRPFRELLPVAAGRKTRIRVDLSAAYAAPVQFPLCFSSPNISPSNIVPNSPLGPTEPNDIEDWPVWLWVFSNLN